MLDLKLNERSMTRNCVLTNCHLNTEYLMRVKLFVAVWLLLTLTLLLMLLMMMKMMMDIAFVELVDKLEMVLFVAVGID